MVEISVFIWSFINVYKRNACGVEVVTLYFNVGI